MESKAGRFLWLIYRYFFQSSIYWGETLCSIIFEPYLTHFFPMFFLALWVVWWFFSLCQLTSPSSNSNSENAAVFGSQKIRAEKPRPRNCRTPWILRKTGVLRKSPRLGVPKCWDSCFVFQILDTNLEVLHWNFSVFVDGVHFFLVKLMTWWRWDDNMIGCWDHVSNYEGFETMKPREIFGSSSETIPRMEQDKMHICLFP